MCLFYQKLVFVLFCLLLSFREKGVVEVVDGDDGPVMMLLVVTLMVVVKVDDMIITEPLFCMLSDGDVL